jgi:SAM-dependent methyltransferase
MDKPINYIDINKSAWNKKTPIHLESAFYDMDGFLSGKTSLKDIELSLLRDIKGKRILHLQCHFGQDTLSLARMGAIVTGVDFSDVAISKAKELAVQINCEAKFICCNIYELANHLDEQFDMIFTTYGTIGWLPDLDKWAAIVSGSLKPGGEFVFVEFHPAVWMFDDDFQKIGYNYFNTGPIVETYSGSYADKSAPLKEEYVMWNHGMGEVINSIINNGMELKSLEEYNYSPYPNFNHTVEPSPGKFRIAHLDDRIPMVYSIKAVKNSVEKNLP